MAHSPVKNKTRAELEAELRAVFNEYPEYSAPAEGKGGFMTMVRLFAHDDFYKLHLVARAYLTLVDIPDLPKAA